MSNYIITKYMIEEGYISKEDAGCISGMVIVVVIVLLVGSWIFGGCQ